METLADAYLKEQERCREVLGQYREIGPAGTFGTMLIEDVLRRADKAAIENDAVEMLRLYSEMRGIA